VAEREFFDLFVGFGQGGLFPHASYYRAGSLHGRPLARLREVLRRFRIERTPKHTEPEDHVALLLAVLAGLADRRITAPAGTDHEIFAHYISPWIGRFFSDLERTASAEFYARVGTLGRVGADRASVHIHCELHRLLYLDIVASGKNNSHPLVKPVSRASRSATHGD
jgi:TorA maturation chaperone TorD